MAVANQGFFMDIFEIEGGKRLSGTIEVRGSKNATTPILAATLLSQKTRFIRGIP
jgi:UDP-N-acetylglucosamine 1-carboxyvinyltransferase